MKTLNNGMLLPDLGFGTFPYQTELLTAIPEAYRIGYCLLDTSDNYDNEVYVGKALQSFSKHELDSITLVTKYSQPARKVKDVFEESTEKLCRNTDKSIDILLMHWPYPHLWKQRYREMEELYEEGKCKAIGVCNFTSNYLIQLLKFCRIKPMINQFECHPMFQQDETYKLCKKEDIQVMSYSPLARMNGNLFGNSVLKNLAEKHGKTVSQIILRWNIQTDRIPIPASKSEDHIKSNFDIFDFELAEADVEAINLLECGMRIRYNPDTRFGTRQKLSFLKKSVKLRLGMR